MKNMMKNALVVIAFVFGGIVTSQAQPKGGGPKMPSAKEITEMVATLDKSIDMSEEQETQVEALFTKQYAAMEEKMSEGRPSREDMEEIKTTFEKGVKKVLTEEQQKGFETFMKSQQKEKKGDRPERR